MTGYREELEQAVATLRGRAPERIDVAVILGSGLGAFADRLAEPVVVPYGDVPHLPVSTVQGHAGRYVFGRWGDLRVGVMAGRVHLYEGLDPARLVLPVRTLLSLGAGVLVVTNASGAVSESVDAGDLVLIKDHINLAGRNPLVGPNDESLGPRFPDMQNAYDADLRALARDAGRAVGITLSEGVYAFMLGPSYETPAEIRMLAAMGGDLVGMSTVPEVIAARHMGVEVLGISCATNRAAGRPGAKLDHEDVQRVARQVSSDFIKLLGAILERLGSRGSEQDR
jgi:purine-nucleoside phosphorylase